MLSSCIAASAVGRLQASTAAAAAVVHSAQASVVAVGAALSCSSLLPPENSALLKRASSPTTSDVTSDCLTPPVQTGADDPFDWSAELLLLDATSEEVYTDDEPGSDDSRERRRYQHCPPLVIPTMNNVDLGKSTAGFAGSEPAVPFSGRPPDFNSRPVAGSAPNTHPFEAITHDSTDPHYYRNLHIKSHHAVYKEAPPFFTHYSGFAGIGVLSLAWRHTGAQCAGGFEFDPAAAAVFKGENPGAQVDGDWYDLDMAQLPSCDVYDAGAPCQTYSVAGP